jgi:cytochrome subunit of sulfide dehydrogenase
MTKTLAPRRAPNLARAGSSLILALAAWPALVAAQPSAPDRAARTWAATCATCHSPDQRAPAGIPPIVGRDAETIYRTLLEFKNGQRPAATVMHQHAKGYTDDELRRIANVLAATPAPR